MPKPVWYRSIYWRFALAFVALLATLLGVQVFIFMWMTGQMPELFPSRTSAQFASSVATELSATLKEQPDTDLSEFITKNYPRAFRAFVIAMKDCRLAYNKLVTQENSGMLFGARFRLGSDCPGGPRGPRPDFGRGPEFGRGGDAGRGGDPGREGFGRRGGRRGWPFGPPPGPPVDFAPVFVDNVEVGMVAVANDPPP